MRTLKQQILDNVMEIREEIGMEQRSPVITRVSKSKDALYIECEDRADKSIVIGTGGWVVGKLASRLGYREVKVESRLDNILRTRMLLRSLRELETLENDEFVRFAKAFIHGKGPAGHKVHVLGEEMLWACGLMEDLDCSPILLHTDFIHENVKNAYPSTDFIRVECSKSPYDIRLEEMVSHAILNGQGQEILFGQFEAPLEEVNCNVKVNPMAFFCIDNWRAKKYYKKRFRSNVFEASDENKSYLTRNVLAWTVNGLIEPTDAARILHRHWVAEGQRTGGDLNIYDSLTKRYRVQNALRKAKETSQGVFDLLNNFLTESEKDISIKALVAWSGGIDSTACVEIALRAGADVDLVTVRMPHIEVEELRKKADSWGLRLVEMKIPEPYALIVNKVEEGNVHPCGQCSSIMETAIKDYASSNGYDVLIFGDLLSVGSQSINEEDGLIIVNLPAALSMPKRELMELASIDSPLTFGCPLVNMAHQVNRDAQRISIQRVLRELRAGMLDTELAKELINDIKGHSAFDI